MGSMSFADMETFVFLEVLEVYEEVASPAEWLAELPEWVEDASLCNFDVHMLAGSVDFKQELVGKEFQIVKEYGTPIENLENYMEILVWGGRTPLSLELLPFIFRIVDRQKFSLYDGNDGVIVMDNKTKELLFIRGDTADTWIERCRVDNIVSVLGVACGCDTEKGKKARQLFYEIAQKLIGQT